ncbi:MAG: HU family DNA-binding protein [Nitrospirae bacterium]|nr:HU family DNA-binding protein [Nitrospirota bacterium]
MHKSELINEISKKTKITKTDAAKVFDSVINTIIIAAKDDQKVTLIGFGTFYVQKRAERIGRNPHTGAKITIPASNVPKFTAGSAFKDIVNK